MSQPSVEAAEAETSAQLERAKVAVSAVFVASGFAFASWAARIPQVRDHLHLDPSELGLLLLSIAVGSIIALPLSGLSVAKLGEAHAIEVMVAILSTGLVIIAVGYHVGVALVAVGLFLVGFGNGTWDVAMNIQGAVVEQRLERAIMPRFHAGYSIGTVAGAGVGAVMVAAHVSVTVHLAVVAVIVLGAVPAATRRFLPHVPVPGPSADTAAARGTFAAWTEPRTILIGVLVLCMGFTEGTGNDWLSVSMIDGYGASAVVGTLTFAVFLAAMTFGRWFGPLLLDRYGRVRALRVCAATACVGLLLVVFGHWVPVAIAGAVLWGIGASLGFPVGLSAAADDPRHAAGRVSTAASIGYVAFLAGPPVIGFLGDHVGTLRSLTIAAILLVLAFFVSGATAPLVPVSE